VGGFTKKKKKKKKSKKKKKKKEKKKKKKKEKEIVMGLYLQFLQSGNRGEKREGDFLRISAEKTKVPGITVNSAGERRFF